MSIFKCLVEFIMHLDELFECFDRLFKCLVDFSKTLLSIKRSQKVSESKSALKSLQLFDDNCKFFESKG